MEINILNDIDIVLLWVDGSDPQWLAKRRLYTNEGPDDSSDSMRFRDYGTLKYVFRSIEKYAPWCRKIHIITDHQVPGWLDLNNPKINLVDHTDFIPSEYLPTFNSNTIELNLFRLKDLSEKFILMNDDMFFNGETRPADFFNDDKIVDYGIYNKIAPTEEFAHILVNDMIFINKYFDKKSSVKKNWRKQFSIKYGTMLIRNFLLLPWNDIPGYYNQHLPQPHFKSVFSKLYNLEPEMFNQTFKNKFRGYDDINHWICRYWLLEEGKYLPQKISFGKYFQITKIEKIESEIISGKSRVICINDEKTNLKTFNVLSNRLNTVFAHKFTDKSIFEK